MLDKDPDIAKFKNIAFSLSKSNFQFSNIEINETVTRTNFNLDFEDNPYIEYADYVYNTNDERIMTITSSSSSSYFPYKSYIYIGTDKS